MFYDSARALERSPSPLPSLPVAPSTDPIDARRALARWLRAELDADAVVYQRFVVGPEGPLHACVEVEGSARLAGYAELEGQLATGLPSALSPTDTSPALRNRLRAWRLQDRREHGERSRVFRRYLEPNGFSDQARMIAYAGRTNVGYASAMLLGGRRFERDRMSLLEALGRPLRDQLAEVQRMYARFEMPRTLVLDADGEVQLSDRAVPESALGRRLKRWLANEVKGHGRARVERGVSYFEGYEAQLSVLRGPVSSAWGIELRRLPDVELDPLAALTGRQRTVARLAARGDTIHDIGRELCLSPNTVKSHVKRIYETLGLAGRVDLARVVNGEAPESLD